MADQNIELLTRVAEALGDLRERLVFIGGCAPSRGFFRPEDKHERHDSAAILCRSRRRETRPTCPTRM